MQCAGFIDGPTEEIAKRAEKLDERIIPISLRDMAMTAFTLCADDRNVITVGSSANDIVKYWPNEVSITNLPMTVANETRVREERILLAGNIEQIDGPRYLVDDVAVSGLTLSVARDSLSVNDGDSAVVGMAWDSRRLRKLVGMPLESAVLYRQQGGGKPAINSLSTLTAKPQLRQEYALRRFGNPSALDEIITIYEGEKS